MWAAVVLLALAAEPPLNDANVVSMIRAGMPESSIVLAIQLAGRRGNVDFDISPSALIVLKSQGATANILNAIQTAQAQKATPGLPYETGLYFQTASGWVQLGSFMFWPSFQMPDMSRKLREMKVPAPAPRLRTDASRPVLYARGLDPAARWEFLKLTGNNKLRVAWTDSFPPRPQIDADAIVPAEVASVAPGVFTLRPAWSLNAGEYLACDELAGAHNILDCRPFTVAQK